MKFGIRLEILILGTLGSERLRVNPPPQSQSERVISSGFLGYEGVLLLHMKQPTLLCVLHHPLKFHPKPSLCSSPSACLES